MIFKTISGSIYEIRDGQVRRINPEHKKQADGEWVTLLNEPVVEVGKRVHLSLQSLADLGPDDLENTVRGDVLSVTSRLTTEVEWIENTDHD